MSFVPIFSEIVDSSLWCQPDCVVKVFITMLAKKDRDHIVRGSAFAIAQWAKKSEAEVLECLKVLSSPDTSRLEPQPFDGRRIEKVEDGWLILNGEKYQKRLQQISRAAYSRNWMRDHRAKENEKGSKKKRLDPLPTTRELIQLPEWQFEPPY